MDWQMDQADATGRTEVADLIGQKVDTKYAMKKHTDHQHTLPTSENASSVISATEGSFYMLSKLVQRHSAALTVLLHQNSDCSAAMKIKSAIICGQ